MKRIGKYSFGTGDRFGKQGIPQLQASILAKKEGIGIIPVWNKSYREHKTVKTDQALVRQEADIAIKVLDWNGDYLVDADHINLSNVDEFLPYSDFFTIDVADYIGKESDEQNLLKFIELNRKYIGDLKIPGIVNPFKVDDSFLRHIAKKFLIAVEEAGNIYRYIAEQKGQGNFIAEVSMDEVEDPQTPAELFFILAALSSEGIPLQTIAPKFTGRFNKGVDYVGDIDQFNKEFEEDLLVIDFAVKEFDLPGNLKLSVHSGSDKFSIYGPINSALKKYGKGVHVKTAGTTWLEELAGLALGGGDGLSIAKAVYQQALERFDELTGPYSTVIDVHKDSLPPIDEVNEWDSAKFASTLIHDQNNPVYNPEFRQLLHCSYKIAGEMGNQFLDALDRHKDVVAQQVTHNLFYKHIKPIFKDL
ncbi:tagaturonate epimerase family protein [Bacteroidota bacterium]